MSTIKVDTWQDRAGTQDFYGALAWVKLNGTGTIAILGSGNVSSLTDIGTGRYQLNFTTAMPDVNYSVAVSTNASGTGGVPYCGAVDYATGTCEIRTTNASAFADNSIVSAVVFR